METARQSLSKNSFRYVLQFLFHPKPRTQQLTTLCTHARTQTQGIINQLGPNNLKHIQQSFAESAQSMSNNNDDSDDDDDVPDLVENFDEVGQEDN